MIVTEWRPHQKYDSSRTQAQHFFLKATSYCLSYVKPEARHPQLQNKGIKHHVKDAYATILRFLNVYLSIVYCKSVFK